jgi:hypothetical protein
MAMLPTTHVSRETIIVRGLSVQSLLVHTSRATQVVTKEQACIGVGNGCPWRGRVVNIVTANRVVRPVVKFDILVGAGVGISDRGLTE